MPDMSADDQYFLDFISNIPDQITSYTRYLASSIDTSFDNTAASIRHHLASSTWLPSSLRPAPPPPSPPSTLPLLKPLPLYSYARAWVDQHRALSATFVAFFGTGGLLLWRQKKAYKRKRRAKRAANGSRREVIVVMGCVDDAITRSVVLDLERRGFIVYVIATSSTDEETVRSLRKVDVLPLHLDVSNPLDVENTLTHFNLLFSPMSSASSPRTSKPSTQPSQQLLFTALVLIPSVTTNPTPLETLSPDSLSDALNAHVLATITTAQSFLRSIIAHNARLLLLTPSIIASLRPPFHAVESTVFGALEYFAASLRAEMATLGVQVCHLKLGTFDTAGVGGANGSSGSSTALALARSARAELLSWPDRVRAAYARNFVASTEEVEYLGAPGAGASNGVGALQRRARGSPLRELNNAVFDMLARDGSLPAVLNIGKGSRLYPFIGNWVPQGVVGWMLGLRRVNAAETANPLLVDGQNASRAGKGSEVWEKV